MTRSPYQIRPPLLADHDQWNLLWQGYLRFYESEVDPAITDLLWQRIIDPTEEIDARVAIDTESKLVGLVHFFPHAHTWYNESVCYLNDLFVAPEIRGEGIGRHLIEAVVAQARRQKWAEVYWHTQQHNSVARGLYDKITGGTDGFVNYTIDTAN